MAAETPVSERMAAPATKAPVILAALIFAGFNLRTVLLEAPPILPIIQRDLGLSYTATGLLNSLPPLLLGGLAFPAALIIGRIGPWRAMTIALAAITGTTMLRALAVNAATLFGATILLSVAIALGQTSVPLVVNQWFGRHIGQVTAAYSTGLMVGEIAAAALTAPLLLDLVGSWRGTFLVWAAPVLLALIAWVIFVPRDAEQYAALASTPPRAVAIPADPAALAVEGPPAPPRRMDLRSWRVWQASLTLGAGSLLFFGMDTWIPVFYAHRGYGDGPLALTILTVAQLPASLALTAWGHHVAGRRIGFIVAGGVATAALATFFIAPSSWYLALIGITGAASAAIFVLGLSLPNYLTTGPEVARVSGIMLGISYTLAFVGPFIGGVLWDSTHIDITAFIPILIASAAVLILGTFMPDLRRG